MEVYLSKYTELETFVKLEFTQKRNTFHKNISKPIFAHRCVWFSQPGSNFCCPRDCVSRHNGGTSGAPLKPLRVDSASDYSYLP